MWAHRFGLWDGGVARGGGWLPGPGERSLSCLQGSDVPQAAVPTALLGQKTLTVHKSPRRALRSDAWCRPTHLNSATTSHVINVNRRKASPHIPGLVALAHESSFSSSHWMRDFAPGKLKWMSLVLRAVAQDAPVSVPVLRGQQLHHHKHNLPSSLEPP